MRRFPELNGSKFSALPTPLQNALMIRPYLRVTTLLKQSDPYLKYEVFLRLNTGGDLLKPQEIRNVAYSGNFNDLLFELSSIPFLKNRLKIANSKSPAFRNMDDVEHVLRFFTINEKWQSSIGANLSSQMDFFMAEHRNLSDSVLSNFREEFIRALNGCERIWGEHAFQKSTPTGWREQLISPLYDAQMVAASSLSDAEIDTMATKRLAAIALLRQSFDEDKSFERAISQGTNSIKSIKTRIQKLIEISKSVLAN